MLLKVGTVLAAILVVLQGCHWNFKGSTDLVFVVDHSEDTLCTTSANPLACQLLWEDVVDMMALLVKQFNQAANRVAMVTYQGTHTQRWGLDRYTDKEELVDAIEELKLQMPDKGANLKDAIVYARDNILGGSMAQNKVMIVITAGSTEDDEGAIAEANQATGGNVDLFALGLHETPKELSGNLSSSPQEEGVTFLMEPDFQKLNSVPYKLLQQACFTLSARVTPPLDLVFVLDGSSSVCASDPSYDGTSCNNWAEFRDFVAETVEDVDVDSGAVQIALVTTSGNSATRVFNLDRYDKKADIMAFVSTLPYPNSGRSIPVALALAASEVFLDINGNRRDADNVAIVLVQTDADPALSPPSLDTIHLAGVKTFVVGINATGAISQQEFTQMSSLPRLENENYFLSSSWVVLPLLRGQMMSAGGFVSTKTTTLTPSTTKEPKPTTPGFCSFNLKGPTDLVFLADHSDNVCVTGNCKDNWGETLDMMKSIIEYLELGRYGVRIGLVLYEDNGQVMFPLTDTNKESLINAFDTVKVLPPGDASNLADGIRDARNTGFGRSEPGRNKIMVIVAAGEPNREVDNLAEEVRLTLADGINMFSIGTTNNVSAATLASVTSPPNEEYRTFLRYNTFTELDATPYFFLSSVCMDFDIRMDPPLDMVFLLDGSLTVCDEDPSWNKEDCPACTCSNWEAMKLFIIRMIDELDVAEDRIRMGLVTTDDISAVVHIKLDDYYDKEALKAAVRAVNFPDGLTNLDAGLRMAMNDVFKQSGDRDQANDVLITLLESESDPGYPIADAVYELMTSNIRSFPIAVLGTMISDYTVRSISSLPKEYEKTYFGSSFGGLDYARELLLRNAGFKDLDKLSTCTWELEDYTDLVFVLDHSDNVCEGVDALDCVLRWEDILDLVTSVVNQVDLDYVRVSVVTYGEGTYNIRWNFNDYRSRDELRAQIINLKTDAPDGAANATAGLEVMRTVLFSQPESATRNKMAIFLAAGPSINDAAAIAAGKDAHLSNIYIFSVGAGQNTPEDLVKDISSLPREAGKSYIIEPDYEDLVKVPYYMFQEACLELTSKVSPPLDLVFVLDGSISVCADDPSWDGVSNTCNNWDDIKLFVNEIIDELDVDSGAVQVGMVSTEGLDARVRWNLDGYSTKASLKSAVMDMGFPGSLSAFPKAVEYMRTNVFTSAPDRRDADNVAILVIEGDPDPDRTWADESTLMHEAGIKAFSVGFLGNITMSYLKGLSSLPREERKNWFACYFYERQECRDYLIGSAGFKPEAQLTTTTTMAPSTTEPLPTPAPDCTWDFQGGLTDVVFIADHSASSHCVGEACKWGETVDLMMGILRRLQLGEELGKAGLVLVKGNAAPFLPLVPVPKENIINAFDSVRILRPGGNDVNIAEGLRDARTAVFDDSTALNKLAIYIGAGEATLEQSNIQAEAEMMVQAGIHVFAIGVTDKISDTTLKLIASPPEVEYRSYLHLDDYEDMPAVPYLLLSSVCMQLDTHIDPPLDLVFVMDGSFSVCDEDPTFDPDSCPECTCDRWEAMKNFAVETVEQLDISESRVRVGLVTTRSIGARIQFALDKYYNKTEIQNAIRELQFPDGLTNLQEAMRLMRTRVFGMPGDRAEPENAAVIILDGDSDPTEPVEDEALLLRASYIRTFVVGVKGTVNDTTLRQLSSLPVEEDRTYFKGDYSQLPVMREKLLQSAGFRERENMVSSTTSSGSSTSGSSPSQGSTPGTTDPNTPTPTDPNTPHPTEPNRAVAPVFCLTTMAVMLFCTLFV